MVVFRAAAAFTGVDAQRGFISISDAAGDRNNPAFHLQFGSEAPALLMKSIKEVFDEQLQSSKATKQRHKFNHQELEGVPQPCFRPGATVGASVELALS